VGMGWKESTVDCDSRERNGEVGRYSAELQMGMKGGCLCFGEICRGIVHLSTAAALLISIGCFDSSQNTLSRNKK
jgi:hypothetical protein